MEKIDIDILPAFIGTDQKISGFSFGERDAKPFIHIQAGLHAGEHPGILVAYELRKLLTELSQKGKIIGRLDLFPAVNPIGLTQFINGEINGRYDLLGKSNFNRQYPNISKEVIDRVLKVSPLDCSNEVLHKIITEVVEELESNEHVSHLRHMLFGRGLKADLVMDLHCDGESLLHIFCGSQNIVAAQILGREIGSHVTVVGQNFHYLAFDDSINEFWNAIKASDLNKRGNLTIGGAITVELRGRADVDPLVAKKDAKAILRTLYDLNVIEEDEIISKGRVDIVETLITTADKVEVVHAFTPGIIAYKIPLGTVCNAGDTIAEIIHPTNDEIHNEAIKTDKGGLLFSRHVSKLSYPGIEVCKIAKI